MAITRKRTTAQYAPKPLDEKSDAELRKEAEARLKRLDPTTAAAVVQTVVGRPVSDSVTGFVSFLREHAIVGLAVGFAIGTQVQTVVKAFTSGFVDQLFALLFPGNKSLSARTFTLHFQGRHADFGWGSLASTLLDFVFVLFVIYLVIKLFRLDKLDTQKK